MPIAKNPKSDDFTRNLPSAEFRDSNIRVAIWPSTGDDGITRYSVKLTRSYQAAGEWKQTSYLGRFDLQRARKLLDRADDWIFVKGGVEASQDSEAAA
ncbi:MAG: hypothetical protein EOP84_16300 [Verrucomicrobiaceae bacterium]|nr:MAG: hypothetical protein EOP84_16300 [Verrucomicrobiaceae bacterium]